MRLELGHREQQGVNINTDIFVRVLSIYPDKGAEVAITNRTYRFNRDNPSWRASTYHDVLLHLEGRHIAKDLEIKVVDFHYDKDKSKSWNVGICYDSAPQYRIVRADFVYIIDQWRPVFKNDGIGKNDFVNEPKELYVASVTKGPKLAYALVKEPQFPNDVAYFMTKPSDKFNLIARITEGKIIPPDVQNNSSIEYGGTYTDNIDYLLSIGDELRYMPRISFLVPTKEEFIRNTSAAFKTITEQNGESELGEVDKQNLEDLMYKQK